MREPSIDYRRWAFESAALDLALRQAGRRWPTSLGREPRPVTFVMSLRLGEPATIEPVRRRLESYPTLRFKLDPTNSWNEALVQELVETGAVDSVDLKGMYKGTPVDVEPTPGSTRWSPRRSPTPGSRTPTCRRPSCARRSTAPATASPGTRRSTRSTTSRRCRSRRRWSTSSRRGSGRSSRLFAAYDYCDERGIGAYGGGQFELGPGRGHIQYLASLFHPDTPNDVAPSPYNLPEPPPGLPVSPLEPRIDPIGFRWAS